ncbi:ABC transporter related (permease component) protein [Herbaspirillum rubrisubalbicans M1]|uniref:ABC transporter permease n=1 Tax=Herbaspirillum rubrisubalbicans TaxID=80842 RepID=UPI00073A27F4|nr:ABC transporter permease [Herbaspirillum rubrisubalbicans]ALU87683.1 ABC transporter related (permease component) protein [Herbaspirillum rubrisubalbicans M1]
MLLLVWKHRNLLVELTKREFSAKYMGSAGGVVWAFLQPIFLLAVYTTAFGVILKTRWGGGGGATDYAMMLFAGLILFNAFSEVMIKSPSLITANPNFVKKIVFPLELLPVVTVLSALMQACISVVIWLVGYAIFFGFPSPTVVLFPVVLLIFAPMLLGIGWLFSAVGVVFRDVGQVSGMLAHVMLFLTPIFYSVDTAPAFVRKALMINPLTFVVDEFRNVLFVGHGLSYFPCLAYFACACLFAWFALQCFKLLRSSFADLV